MRSVLAYYSLGKFAWELTFNNSELDRSKLQKSRGSSRPSQAVVIFAILVLPFLISGPIVLIIAPIILDIPSGPGFDPIIFSFLIILLISLAPGIVLVFRREGTRVGAIFTTPYIVLGASFLALYLIILSLLCCLSQLEGFLR